MTVQISYKNSAPKEVRDNLLLFTDQNFNVNNLKKYLSKAEFSYIFEMLKSNDLKKEFLLFEINSKKTIFLASVKKDFKISDVESLGAKFHSYINYKKKK